MNLQQLKKIIPKQRNRFVVSTGKEVIYVFVFLLTSAVNHEEDSVLSRAVVNSAGELSKLKLEKGVEIN